MSRQHEDGAALWLDSFRSKPRVGRAPRRTPGPLEVVVRVRAVAVNPIDLLGGLGRRVVLPWLRYPAVLGTDVAGVVEAVGTSVTRLRIGDHVVGHAAASERSHNRAEEGAFQTHVVLQERMTSPLPEDMSFEDAAVLPLALSTAAAGLFEHDQLGLRLPALDATALSEVVVVWGGSTSVGMNAIQLAANAGYRVLATCSPRNFGLVKQLGAEAAFDYHERETSDAIGQALDGRPLAGVMAIGAGSLAPAIRISRRARGTKRIASAYPTPQTRVRAFVERRRGIGISAIWGGSPVDSPVGAAIYAEFLPAALRAGRYRPAPVPLVVGNGLDSIPAAFARLNEGVSAQKVVVTLD